MKVFSASQIKAWDAFSIREEAIDPDILMQRAAASCYQWLLTNDFVQQPIHIFCGKGNNGGDGLALAAMLLQNNSAVNIFILESGKPGSRDFQLNLERLHKLTTNIHFIQSAKFFPVIEKDHLLIDTLFGTGLNKPLGGISLQLIEYINSFKNTVISIDMPSGLSCDCTTSNNTAITATHTLSFQTPKLAFLMPENDRFTGALHILDIGLSKNFEDTEPSVHELTDVSLIKSIVKPRNKFSHKGNFGHAAIIAGSYGMMGAAVLAARACLQTGTGKLTCHIPAAGYDIMQISLPEAMCKTAGEKFIESVEDVSIYNAIGIGPGLGTQIETAALLHEIFSRAIHPLVLDADALNCIAAEKKLMDLIPADSVITPHPKEFEKMFGKPGNDFARLQLAIDKAATLKIYIVLKGHYTAIITPKGKVYFNSTGNAGMAKAGMGDVLTGMITGLLCQGYPLPEAALLGVYLHGMAGDIAAAKYSPQAMQASDLIDCISDSWKLLV